MEFKTYYSLKEVSEITFYPINSLYREISEKFISRHENGVSIEDVLKLLDRRIITEKKRVNKNIGLLEYLENSYKYLGNCLSSKPIEVKREDKKEKTLETTIEIGEGEEKLIRRIPSLSLIVEPIEREKRQFVRGSEYNFHPTSVSDKREIVQPPEGGIKYRVTPFLTEKEKNLPLNELVKIIQGQINRLKKDLEKQPDPEKKEDLENWEIKYRNLGNYFSGVFEKAVPLKL